MNRAIKRQICLSKWFILGFILLVILYSAINISHKLPVINEENIVPSESLRYEEFTEENSEEMETSTVLDTYVVEEHHEVIPYWFKAANAGTIPRYGNTLIHIDGHNDMAPPHYFRKFPFFHWPENTDQLKYYMQENDMFIMSAAISGLISKVIWIWPKWDRVNHESHHFATKMDIGWTKVKTRIPNLKRKEFCLCVFNVTNKDTDCRAMPISDEDEEAYINGVRIKLDDCNIQRSILFEEYREEKAVQLLKASNLYLKGSGTILDIDEDYYGCTYASQPIRDAGVTLKTMDKINIHVSKLFCPGNSKEELESDSVLVKILQNLNNISCTLGGKSTNGKMCANPRIIKDVSKKFKDQVTNEKSHLLCKIETPHFDEHFQKLMDELKNLTIRQNKALQFVGFCFNLSPKSFDTISKSWFQICQGNNIREDTAVLEHQPDLAELSWRTRVLGRILSSVKTLNPGIVTVCRSGRDGYTPRELFNQIENDVLGTLKNTFSNAKITYDAGLLGGIKGWPQRYKSL